MERLTKQSRRDKQLEKSKKLATNNLRNMIPFEKWCRLRNPTDSEIEHYHKIAEGLKEIAANGCKRSITSATVSVTHST